MINKKRIFLDMDGILADFTRGICQHHNVLYPNPWPNLGVIGLPENCGLAKDVVWKGVDHEFWDNLPKTVEADDVVNLAKHYFPIKNIFILTAYPREFGLNINQIDELYKGKLIWIERYYPEFIDNFYVGRNKYGCAGPDTLLVDDHDKNVDAFIKYGGNAILFPRPWNRNHQLDPIVYFENMLYERFSQL